MQEQILILKEEKSEMNKAFEVLTKAAHSS